MDNERKYSLFISSTYKDLVNERNSILNVALENDFIPIGMEQFGANPLDRWDIITRMIDRSDAYLLIIAGCYGTIAVNGISWTEREYDYARSMDIPVIALLREKKSIMAEQMDENQDRLNTFRDRVLNESFTSDFFGNDENLQYKATKGLHNMKDHLRDSNSGWVRYSDVQNMINNDRKQYTLDNAAVINAMTKAMTTMSDKIHSIENSFKWEEIGPISDEEVKERFK